MSGWPAWLDKAEENAKRDDTCLDCGSPDKGYPKFAGEGCKHK